MQSVQSSLETKHVRAGVLPQQMAPSQQPKQTKALRFVTNYGAPHPKRRRIGAACLTCRKRKTACSGERPTCETCKQNKLDCAGYASEAQPSTTARRSTTLDPHERPPSASSDRSEAHKKSRSSDFDSAPADQTNIDPALRNHTDDDRREPRKRERSETSSGGTISSPPTHDSAAAPSIYDLGRDGINSLFSRPRDRMPYFRWLGPTAIMPGFKQMVVRVKRQDNDHLARSSTNGEAAPARLSPNPNDLNPQHPSMAAGIYSPATAASAAGGGGGGGVAAAGGEGAAAAAAAAAAVSGESEARTPLSLPFYDNSPVPPSELITHLAHTFFTHLGCNYPFLQRERFLRDLEEKQVDATLVDAVCALAARFSVHPLLTSQVSHPAPTSSGQHDEDTTEKQSPAEYGHAFAQRAKATLVDTFACPSVAAVQAALLLAYLEFGESRDSGLWMYLGISIRMAQDLGLHTVEGLKYKGTTGLTPKMVKRQSSSESKDLPPVPSFAEASIKESGGRNDNSPREKIRAESTLSASDVHDHADDNGQVEEQKAVEQERIDTFWAVFFLDRVISSGTGRRSTLRDKDIDVSFPALDEVDKKSGWPAPFPALIRIVHLYGRVADLLNSIKEPSDITSHTSARLATMESQVTQFYQGLSSRLHFDAVNFQHYTKAGEGTNFVLLHFWFHMLIVLLHQPTLLKTFEGNMLQLFPNSQQLSLSSAKTIADILSYSQLLDAKASLGNPFTSQPIYIAACAFLKETAEQTASSAAHSRASSPSRKGLSDSMPISRPGSMSGLPPGKSSVPEITLSGTSTRAQGAELSNGALDNHKMSAPSPLQPTMDSQKSAQAKHTLLATAATQHYQLCYKALQSLEIYWSGAKYILTILNQKFEGVEDPLLYTAEESESSMEQPKPVPEFVSPGWRRKWDWAPCLPGSYLSGVGNIGAGLPQSPFWKSRGPSIGDCDPSKAIGWTLTGTMNSPSTNLAWHYPLGTMAEASGPGQQMSHMQHLNPATPQDYSSPSLKSHDPSAQGALYHQHHHLGTNSTQNGSPHPTDQPFSHSAMMSQASSSGAISNVDAADLLLGLNNPYQSYRNSSDSPNTHFNPRTAMHSNSTSDVGMSTAPITNAGMHYSHQQPAGNSWMTGIGAPMQPFGDVMIESQDVDMSLLGLDMPWFDNFPTHDIPTMMDPGNGVSAANGGGGSNNGMMHHSGPPQAHGTPGGPP